MNRRFGNGGMSIGKSRFSALLEAGTRRYFNEISKEHDAKGKVFSGSVRCLSYRVSVNGKISRGDIVE